MDQILSLTHYVKPNCQPNLVQIPFDMKPKVCFTYTNLIAISPTVFRGPLPADLLRGQGLPERRAVRGRRLRRRLQGRRGVRPRRGLHQRAVREPLLDLGLRVERGVRGVEPPGGVPLPARLPAPGQHLPQGGVLQRRPVQQGQAGNKFGSHLNFQTFPRCPLSC